MGEKMPTKENHWLEEFEKYKQYPEFQLYGLHTCLLESLFSSN